MLNDLKKLESVWREATLTPLSALKNWSDIFCSDCLCRAAASKVLLTI